MGNEIILYTHVEGLDDSIIARIAPQNLPDPGHTLELSFDLSKLHLFSGADGEKISKQEPVRMAT
jgi:hypothetical protein